MPAAEVSRDDEGEPAESGFIVTVRRELVGETNANSDLRILEHRIADLERERPIGEKGFTKAGVAHVIRIPRDHVHMRHGLNNPDPTTS